TRPRSFSPPGQRRVPSAVSLSLLEARERPGSRQEPRHELLEARGVELLPSSPRRVLERLPLIGRQRRDDLPCERLQARERALAEVAEPFARGRARGGAVAGVLAPGLDADLAALEPRRAGDRPGGARLFERRRALRVRRVELAEE